MKKALFLSIVLVLAVAIFPLPAGAQENLISNGGFETPDTSGTAPADWYTYSWSGTPTFTWDNTVAHTGTYSVKISGEQLNSVWYQDVTLEPGATYRLEGWVKTENISYSARGACIITGYNNASIGGVELHGTNDWTQIVGEFTPTVSATDIRLYAGSDTSGVTSIAWFDDISLVKIAEPPTELKNPGFEIVDPEDPTKPADWSRTIWSGDVTMVLDSVVVHSGKYSAKITGTDLNACWGQDFPLKDDGLYHLEGWVKTDNLEGGRGACIILGFNNMSLAGVELHGTNDWTKISGEFFFPAGTYNWPPTIRCYGGGTGTVWFDDMKLEFLCVPASAPASLSATPGDQQITLSWSPSIQGTYPVDHYIIYRVTVGEGTNLVQNPGFEEPDTTTWVDPANWGAFTYWRAGAEPIYEWQTNEVHSGDLAVMIKTASDDEADRVHAMWYQYVDVEPFSDYLLSGWVKTVNVIAWEHPGPPAWGGAMIRPNSGTNEFDPLGEGLFGDNDWTLVTYPVDTKSNLRIMASARIGRNYATSTGTAYFDDISLVKFDSVGVAVDTFYVDTGLINGTTYYYAIRAIDTHGFKSPSSFVQATAGEVGVAERPQTAGQPLTFSLSQNYPNPFNPVTTISYTLPKKTKVTLIIYNLLGQRIRKLVDAEKLPGKHRVSWDGKDDFGRPVGPGVYFYQIKADDFVQVKKLVLLK